MAESMLTTWGDMSGKSRIGLITGIVLVLVFMGFSIVWLLQDRYAVLFADMQPGDAAAVVGELERMKVKYKLEEGGNRILTPEKSVHEVRLKLMGSGMPLSGGVGFEVFDNSDFGMTEFAQRINFQRALQGELTRTIMSLKEVKYARVHLVMPESGLFKRGGATASASVTLFLHNGLSPSGEQILGIQRLVSSAVSGLKASQVTVTDQNGITLSRHAVDDAGMEAVSMRLQQKKAVEQYLADKAMAILKRAFDSDNVLVSVDASIDFNQISTTKESVLPSESGGGSGVVRRRESKFGTDTGAGRNEGNVTTEVEYQLGRSVAQIVETPGKILRLGVGVLVPDTANEERKEQIRQLVTVAIGIDASRGDAVVVYTADPLMPRAATEFITPEWSGQEPAGLIDGSISGHGKASAFGSRLSGFASENSLVLGLAILLAVIVSLLLIINAFSGRPQTGSRQRTLSTQERERVLLKLNKWLEEEPIVPEKDGARAQ